jgi:hypothetical protein
MALVIRGNLYNYDKTRKILAEDSKILKEGGQLPPERMPVKEEPQPQ